MVYSATPAGLTPRLTRHVYLAVLRRQKQHGDKPGYKPLNPWIAQLEQDTGIPADQLWTTYT